MIFGEAPCAGSDGRERGPALKLAVLDLVVLAAYFGGVVALGLWVSRGTRSAAAFMVGDRHQPWWLILASIVATETSTVTFLSIPGFAYERDLTWLQIAFGFLLGRVVVAHLLLPAYFQGTLFTAYEVLAQRFGGATQRTASLLFLVTRTGADGLRLFLTALVLQELAGIPLASAVVATGLVTLAYCYVGGLTAVLWTDLVQLAIYLAGAVVALAVLLDRLPGGLGELLAVGEAAGRLRVFDLSLDPREPYALAAGLVGGAFLALGSHGVDQMMVQRYLSAGSLPAARKALVGSGFVVVAQFALFLVIGVGLFAFYQAHPPAVPFDRPDRVFARFLLEELPPGLTGLLLGALFAAAMSTLSSSLNSCATAVVRDLVVPLRRAPLAPPAELRATRLATVGFGLAQIAVGLAGAGLRTSVVAAVLGIAGLTTGLVLGVFLLGRLPRVGQRAALTGLTVGFAAMTTIYAATPLAWPWYALTGATITVAVGWGASWVGGRGLTRSS